MKSLGDFVQSFTFKYHYFLKVLFDLFYFNLQKIRRKILLEVIGKLDLSLVKFQKIDFWPIRIVTFGKYPTVTTKHF